MSSEQKRPVHVFFSYARRDKTLRDRLEEHLSNLKYRGLITTWHNRDINAGQEWIQQIDIHLDKADIILLLISSSFMASEYCYSIEMQRALERHHAGSAQVVPILLRPVVYDGAPFARLQFLPTNGKPVVIWPNRDSAFVDIALGIERVVRQRLTDDIFYSWGRLDVYPEEAFEQDTDTMFRVMPDVLDRYFDRSDYRKPLPSRRSLSKRSLSRIGLSLLVVVGLLTAVILLAQHPQFIPLVAAIVGGLLLIIGMIVVVRVLRKSVQEKQKRRIREKARRVEQQRLEEEQRRQREARRRQEEERRQREALLRQQEIERQQPKEQVYYIQALEAYGKALRHDPTDVTAIKGQGNALAALGLYDDALQSFTLAISSDPTPSVYVSIGKVYSKLKRYEESLQAYEKALQLDPTYADAYAEMGEVLQLLGRKEEAQQAREKAMQLGYEE